MASGRDFSPIGTRIETPDIDYAVLAKSMGVQSIGPIDDPNELGSALTRAVQIVKAGEPVLVVSVTQPR